MIKSKKNNTLKIKRGDTFVHRFSLFSESADGKIPFNLSDVARIDLQAIADDEIVLSLSTTNSTLITKDNYLLMLVSKKLTQGKMWEDGEYDVQVTYNDNVTKTIASGKIKLEHDVTESKVAEDETSFERAIEFAMQNQASEIVVSQESMSLVFGMAVKGDKGDDGQDGATFTPHLSSSGDLSFSNNKGLDNPQAVNIKGQKGDTGESAYDLWKKQGNSGELSEFLESLKGKKGLDGNHGKSAYQIWLDLQNQGTEQDFINSLKGNKGDNGVTFTPSLAENGELSFTNNGNLENPSPVNLKGVKGDRGNDGKSAYQLWLDQGNHGELSDFLESLKGLNGNDGEDGIDGVDGKNAYQLAQDQGYQGSLEEWLNDRVTTEKLNEAIHPINAKIDTVKNSIQDLTLVNLLDNTSQEISSLNEYLMYRKSPELKQLMLNGTFTLSFDIKVAVAGDVTVYSSNDSGISYGRGVNVPEPNKWFRRSVVIRPKPHATTPENENGTIEFYATYNTGRIPTVRNVKLERGTVATGYTVSPNDLLKPLKSLLEDIDFRLKNIEKKFDTPDHAVGKNYIINSKYFNVFKNNNSLLYELNSGKDGKGQWISGTSKGKYSISTYSEFLNNGTIFSEDLTQQEVTMSAYFNPTHACSIRLDNSTVVRLEPNKWTRVTVSQRSDRMAGMYVEQVDAVVNDEQPFRLYHERWKLEKGNRATDWIE